MKLRIDTDNKVIEVEEEITFGELCKKLSKLMPGGVWLDYKLKPKDKYCSCPYQPIWVNPPDFNPLPYDWWRPITISESSDSIRITTTNDAPTVTTGFLQVQE